MHSELVCKMDLGAWWELRNDGLNVGEANGEGDRFVDLLPPVAVL